MGGGPTGRFLDVGGRGEIVGRFSGSGANVPIEIEAKDREGRPAVYSEGALPTLADEFSNQQLPREALEGIISGKGPNGAPDVAGSLSSAEDAALEMLAMMDPPTAALMPSAFDADIGAKIINVFSDGFGWFFKLLVKCLAEDAPETGRTRSPRDPGTNKHPPKTQRDVMLSDRLNRISAELGVARASTDSNLVFNRPEMNPRLVAMIQACIDDLKMDGIEPRDMVVKVAGGSVFPVETLVLLELGVRVVFREEQSRINTFKRLGRESAVIREAIRDGRLTFSNYNTEDDPSQYDMVIWPHPDLHLRVHNVFGTMANRLRPGGLLIVQSDGYEEENPSTLAPTEVIPLYYMEPIGESNYLLPSYYVAGEGWDRIGGMAGIYRYRPDGTEEEKEE